MFLRLVKSRYENTMMIVTTIVVTTENGNSGTPPPLLVDELCEEVCDTEDDEDVLGGDVTTELDEINAEAETRYTALV